MTAVLILALFLAQQETPPEKCTLSGRVVDAVTGLPLGKVEVVAEHVGGHDPGASTTTDAKGNFLLVEVDPGQYRLAAKRSGYLDIHYGAKQSSGTGSTLTLTAGQKIDDIRIKLTPFGVIAGTVRDSDGEPMADTHVVLYTASYNEVGRRRIREDSDAATDDLGQYRITNLAPGKYYVSAVPRSRNEGPPKVDHSVKSDTPPEAPITTFYPGTADPSTARPIEVALGARITGADISLIRSRLHKVTVHIDAQKGLVVTASLAYSADGFGSVGISRQVNAGGDVEITDVPPGSYIMRFFATEPAKPFDGTIDLFRSQGCDESVPLSVGRNDVAGVRVVAGGCAEVTGHVSFEGDKLPKPGANTIYVDDVDSVGHDALVKADDSFRLLLSPGHHSIDMLQTSGFYVRSIRSGNQDVLRNGFTASGSERIELEVVLSSDGCKVEGVVLDADDKPALGATVVLIPSDPALRSRLDFTKDAVTDQSGHFEFKNAAPGEYKLFAWDTIETSSWFDPDFIKDYEAKGQPMTVKAADSQTVKLHVIP